MKKLFVLIAALVVFAGQVFAAPVDVNTAKTLGAKYLPGTAADALYRGRKRNPVRAAQARSFLRCPSFPR